MNEHESAAMWKLYLNSNEGVAIQSTYKKLKESYIDDEDIYLGMVKYIDYEKEYFDPMNIIAPFIHKRKSFEYEREVRALISKWYTKENGEIDFTTDTIDHGIHIKADLNKLIEKIYIAPNAPSWFIKIVESVVSKYQLNFEIISSKLDKSPIF